MKELARPGRWVSVTLGEEGAICGNGLAPPVTMASRLAGDLVDVTGAGDAFAATMIQGRLCGLNFQDAVEEASLRAAFTCQVVGALGVFPLDGGRTLPAAE